MKNKFKTNKNFLSAYAFKCGYIEQRESEKITLTLFQEHSMYHVQYNRFDLPYSIRKDCRGWDTYETLTEAKKRFFQLCKIFNFKKFNN